VAAGGDDFRPGFGARGPGGPPPPGGPFGNDSADKAAVLEAVLAFYDRFAEQNATNSQLRFEAGKAHRRVGEMHQLFNRGDKAAAAFMRSLKLLESVLEERDNDPDVRYELMLVYSNMPVGPGGAEAQLTKAAELGSIFTTAPRRWALGTVYLKLGWARELAKKNAAAETAYAEAAAAYMPDLQGPFRPHHVATEQALAWQRQAALLADRGQVLEAKIILKKAAEELKPMAGGGPQGRFIREALAAVYQQLAALHARMGETGLANQYRFDAQRLQEGPGGPGGPGGPFPKGPPKGPPPK
jgi:tetratricopeptide (TPR) repeat protein